MRDHIGGDRQQMPGLGERRMGAGVTHHCWVVQDGSRAGVCCGAFVDLEVAAAILPDDMAEFQYYGQSS